MATADIRVGVAGKIFYADTGETAVVLPAAPAGNWVDLGCISDAGVVEAQGSTTTDFAKWGGDTVRTVQTTHTLTYQFVALEAVAGTFQVFYGDAAATDTAFEITAAQGLRKAWNLDVVDGGVTQRIHVPDGQVTAKGNLTYVQTGLQGYDMTITCYPDDTNVKAYVTRVTV